MCKRLSIPLLFLPFFLAAEGNLESKSMLTEAESTLRTFQFEISRTPPPLRSPQPEAALQTASIWCSANLSQLEEPAFEILTKEPLWDQLKEIGIQGIYLKELKEGGKARTGLFLDPKWKTGWNEAAVWIEKKGIDLIGDGLGGSTGWSPDFWLALNNREGYPGLYHLVEIEQGDWNLLPPIDPLSLYANVPWLNLEQLHKKGYVPEQFSPYVKKSRWNTTPPIPSEDGKIRRWIYLQNDGANPLIDWLDPSFAGCRIGAADILDSMYHLGQKITVLSSSIDSSAEQMLSLWIRKLGGFSVLETRGRIEEFKNSSADLIEDSATQRALLHALIAQNGDALQWIYRLFLREGIQTKRLVHSLHPFDPFKWDWNLLFQERKKTFKYPEESLVGETLKLRLLKEDREAIQEQKERTWPRLCMSALNIENAQKERDPILNIHLLVSFFYAMQPGVFSFSLSDLLGIVSPGKIDPSAPNEHSLYGSLPSQMKNQRSFAMRLKKILSARAESGIEQGELLSVPSTEQKGLLILIHRLKKSGKNQLLAINFGTQTANQALEIPSIRETTAIDLMTGLAENKPFSSSTITLSIPPLSGKVIVFQPK